MNKLKRCKHETNPIFCDACKDQALKRELVEALKVCLFHAKFSHQITDRLNVLITRAEKTL